MSFKRAKAFTLNIAVVVFAVCQPISSSLASQVACDKLFSHFETQSQFEGISDKDILNLILNFSGLPRNASQGAIENYYENQVDSFESFKSRHPELIKSGPDLIIQFFKYRLSKYSDRN